MANRITMQFELETLSHVTLSSYHPVACRVPCWDIFGNQGLNILRIKFITNCTVKHPYLVPLTSIPSWVHSTLQHKNNSLETLSFGKTVLIS